MALAAVPGAHLVKAAQALKLRLLVRTDEGQGRSSPGLELAVATALGLGAAWLRIGGLGPDSLWLDDAWIALVHKVEDLRQVARMGVTAPGFAVALWTGLRVFGFSELTAQVLPFLMGVAGPPATFALARRMGLAVVPAAFAGAAIAVAPVHVLYSTAVKQFTTDMVLVVVMLWLADRALHNPSLARGRAALILSLAATVFSASVAPVAVTVILLLGWQAWKAGDRPMLARAGVAIGYLAVWTLVVRQWLPDSLYQYWDRRTASNPVDAIGLLWQVFVGLAGSSGLAVALVLLSISGLAVLPQQRQRLFALPIIVAMVASMAGVPLGGGRTDLYLYGIVAVTSGAGLTVLRRTNPCQAPVAAVLVLAMLLPVRPTGYADPDSHMQEHTRSLVSYVDSSYVPGDKVLLLGSDMAFALYSSSTVTIREAPSSATGWFPDVHDFNTMFLPWTTPVGEVARVFPELDADRVFLLHAHVPEERRIALEEVVLEQGYVREALHQEVGASLVVFQRPEGA